MMLLHKSTCNLYLECCVAAAEKPTVCVENIAKMRKEAVNRPGYV